MRSLLFLLVLAVFASTANANERYRENDEQEFPVLCADTRLEAPERYKLQPEATIESPLKTNVGANRGRATLAALIPGILIHGSGHYAAGDTKTGNRLLLSSVVGASLAAGGGGALLYTGANRNVSEMGIPLLVSGLGIFGASWLADIYGSATGGTTVSRALRPTVAAALGYGHVTDPQFDYEHFVVAEAEFQWSRVGLRPSLWTAADANNQRGRLEASYALYQSSKGTYLNLEGAGTYHAFGDDGFATRVFESSLVGRWNLGGLGPRLSGAFAELSAGFGHETIDFKMSGVESTGSKLLIGLIGFGVQLPGGGETAFYYDHRRDKLAGGLSPSNRRGSGFAGYLGLRYRQPLGRRFALRLMTELGSAWVASGALEARWGRGQ